MTATQEATCIIRIRDLRLHGLVGVLPHERQVPQPLIVNAELHCRDVPALASDNLADTIDYAVVCNDFADILRAHPDHLLERLAARFLDRLLTDPRAVKASVRIAKPHAIANADTVEIELTGQRQEP